MFVLSACVFTVHACRNTQTLTRGLHGAKCWFVFWLQVQKALDKESSLWRELGSSSPPAHPFSSLLLLSHDISSLLLVHTSTLCPSFLSALQFLSPFPSSPNQSPDLAEAKCFFLFRCRWGCNKACQWEARVALSHALCAPSVNSLQPPALIPPSLITYHSPPCFYSLLSHLSTISSSLRQARNCAL